MVCSIKRLRQRFRQELYRILHAEKESQQKDAERSRIEEEPRTVIDLHTHVLPKIDDGSDSVQTSLNMLQLMANHGVDAVCATPHYYAEKMDIPTFLQRRDAAWQALQQATDTLPVPVVLAAEVAYYSGISEEKDLRQLCVEGTNTLMLEMPYSDWNSFQIEEVMALAWDCGFDVVLVHPERLCTGQNNRRWLERLYDLPMQVNAGALCHWRTRRAALNILENTSKPLLGSDCHNLASRAPNLWEGRNVISRKLGADFLAEMEENALKLVQPRIATL